MTLSEIIQSYCNEHGISFRGLARDSGLTNGYITMLVNNVNPRSNKPIRPTIESYAKLAKGMHMTVGELFELLDETPIAVNSSSEVDRAQLYSPEILRLVHAYIAAEADAQKYALQLLEINPAVKERDRVHFSESELQE